MKLPLPRWLVWAGSVAIIFHLFALLIVVLAVPSGPWFVPQFGPSQADAPRFAEDISSLTTQWYLQPLQISANYHFESNKPEIDSVYFEARLRDSRDNVIQTIRFPQKEANLWVWNRQVVIAQGLAEDLPLQPPRSEVITAPGKEMQKVSMWEMPEGGGPQVLRRIPIIKIPRDRPTVGPSEWSQQLARSYSRYLCKQYEAASVELIRHSRRPIFPVFMFTNEGPGPEDLDEIVCSFGEYRLEK